LDTSHPHLPVSCPPACPLIASPDCVRRPTSLDRPFPPDFRPELTASVGACNCQSVAAAPYQSSDGGQQDLISRGVEVSELFHRDGGSLLPGSDPQRRSYLTYASFSDPDGNTWLLQEITTRLPGRERED